MSTHDELDTLLPNLEGPVAPDPEFTAQLRQRFVTASGHRPTAQPRLIPVQPGTVGPTPIRASRRRWLDLAAVAVLLLSMVGGIARVGITGTGGTPTPAIQAPQTEQPVMVGGSAAQDNQFPGPAPSGEAYEPLWTLDPALGHHFWPVLPFGHLIYGIGENNGPGQMMMNVLDARTGELVWAREVSSAASFIVTEHGVVVGVPFEENATRTGQGLPALMRLAMFDRSTGNRIWTSDHTYGSFSEYFGAQLIVDGSNLYFTDSIGSVFALDLLTGKERWGYSYSRTCDSDLSSSQSCSRRAVYPARLAVRGDHIYAVDMLADRVIALSAQSGAEIWNMPMFERVGEKTALGQVMAVDQGVILQLAEPLSSADDEKSYVGLWAAEDGAEIWSTTTQIGGLTVAGRSLFVTYATRTEPCCEIGQLDISSGTELQHTFIEEGMVAGYIPSDDMLLIQFGQSVQGDQPPNPWAGFDAKSLSRRWQFDVPDASCQLVFPALENGDVICAGGGVSVYQPTSVSATQTASPVTDEQPVMAGGSAAMDGSWPGPALARGDYRLRWRGQAPAVGYVAPFRDKIYQYIARVGPINTGGIVAYDAQTGAEHWYQPVTSNFAFAVTSAGVVVGIPDSFDSEGSPAADAGLWDFHVVLLDLDTGQPIWRSAETYQLASAPFSLSAQIMGDTVLFVDRQMTLAALDLATGQEQWRVESSELPAGDCDCTASGPAISGDMVYFDNPVTGQIVAVSLRTGEQKWAVDDPAEPVAPSPGGMMAIRRPIALAAVGQGVVVNTW